jgi:hypothetical protein
MSTYAFNDVVATISGPTGSANLAYGAGPTDEGISFEPAGDKNTMTVGADGTVMHSLHADKTGRVIAQFLKTSPVNALLHAMYDAQTVSASLHGQNTILCQQKAAGDVSTARQCAFKRKPTIRYKKDGEYLEWEWDAGFIDTILGTYPTS